MKKTMSKTFRSVAVATALSLVALAVQAQVTVKDAWVRATVAQQKASGAFMTLAAAQDLRLVAVNSPRIPLIEIHEMSMQGDVMKMRQIPFLALPAGKPVELGPKGYHLMLLNLTQPIQVGENIPLSLVVEDKAGKRQTVEVKAEARLLGAQADAMKGHTH